MSRNFSNQCMQHKKMKLPSSCKNRLLPLLYISFIVLGLSFRCFHVIYYSVQSRDSYVYVDEITEFQKKASVDELKHPALSILFLSIPSVCFGTDITTGGVIVNMIFGELIIVLIMKICYNILRSPISVFYAGILASSNNHLIYYSTQLLRENSYLFFVCAAIELITRQKNETLFKTFLLSLITLCAILCRFEGIEIIFFYTIIKVIKLLMDKHKTQGKFKSLIANYVFYVFAIATVFSVASLLYYGKIQLYGFGVDFRVFELFMD